MSIELYAIGLGFLLIPHFCTILRNISSLFRICSSLGFKRQFIQWGQNLYCPIVRDISLELYAVVWYCIFNALIQYTHFLNTSLDWDSLNAEPFSELWPNQDKSTCLHMCTHILHAPDYIHCTKMYVLLNMPLIQVMWNHKNLLYQWFWVLYAIGYPSQLK